MTFSEQPRESTGGNLPGESPPETPSAEAAQTGRPRALAAGPLTMFVACAVAAALFWYFLPRFEAVFQRPEETLKSAEMSPEAEAEVRALHRNNAMVVYAVLGALLAGVAGLTEGVCRRSVGGSLLGLGAGVVLGAACGAAGAFVANLVFAADWPSLEGLPQTMIMAGSAYLVLSLAVGLTLGLAARSAEVAGRAFLGAAVGGILVAVLFPFAAAIIFPMDATDRVVPTGSGNRLFWSVMTFGVIAAIAVWQGRSAAPRSAENPG